MSESLREKQYRLEETILGITAELKGPMDDFERALLVADRKEWREELEKVTAELQAKPKDPTRG